MVGAAGSRRAGRADPAYLWLVGDAWAGKTSLLAEAATALPGNVDVACYFLSRREADADSWRFLAAVVPQLAAVLDEDTPAADLQHFRALWHRAAESVGGTRHLVLVVDGLDEDLRPPGLPSVASLLPAVAGGHVHVLVSSRPHPDLPSDIPAGHPLHTVRPTPVRPFSGARELAVLARQEIDDLLGRDDDGLATDALGLLTAAAGPLAARDLAALTIASPPSAAVRLRRIRRLSPPTLKLTSTLGALPPIPGCPARPSSPPSTPSPASRSGAPLRCCANAARSSPCTAGAATSPRTPSPEGSPSYRNPGRAIRSPGRPSVTHCGMQQRVIPLMRRMVPGSQRS